MNADDFYIGTRADQPGFWVFTYDRTGIPVSGPWKTSEQAHNWISNATISDYTGGTK